MTKNDKFLQTYREYEAVLRDRGETAQQHEEANPDKIQNRLRMCRVMRNYITHMEDPGFISITDKQMAFMEEYAAKLAKEGDTVKKHLLTPAKGLCKDTDRCQDVLMQMAKLQLTDIIVQTKNGYKIGNIHEIISKGLDSKTTQMKTIRLKREPLTIDPDMHYKDIPEDTIAICISPQDKSKIIGVLYKN